MSLFGNFFKTDACNTCDYNNVGMGLCDTCSNARFPLKNPENHHSDNYHTKEYEKLFDPDIEYEWFGLWGRKK